MHLCTGFSRWWKTWKYRGIFQMSRPRNVMEIVKYDHLMPFLSAMSLKWFPPLDINLQGLDMSWGNHANIAYRNTDWTEGLGLHAALLQELKTCIIREVIRHKPLYQIVHLICLILVYHLMDTRAIIYPVCAKLRQAQILRSIYEGFEGGTDELWPDLINRVRHHVVKPRNC